MNQPLHSLRKLVSLVLLIALFTACSSVGETFELENAGGVKYLKIRVASDQDDAEERASGKVVTSSTDLELTYDVKRGQQLVGVRFRSVAVPQGATIQRAQLRFKADETDEGNVRLDLYGDNSDSAAPFVESDRNLSSRAKTSTKVSWQPPAWRRIGESGGKQYADIAPLLQEVVSREGWRSGNAFAVLISSDSKSKRVAESYRGDKYGAPQLYVEYIVNSLSAGPSAPAPAPEPVAKATSALYVALGGSDSNDGRSVDNPVKTIYKALQLVEPGDTVYLRGGVYKGKYQSYFGYDRQPFTTSGTQDKPITITSYPGERAIVDGSDRHWSNYESLSSPELFKVVADYYVIQDLTFRNGAGRGLYIRGKHVTVRNVLSHNHHSDGIYFKGDYGTFENIVSHSNYSEQNGGDSADGIKIAYGAHNTVRNSLAYDNSDDGIDIFCASKSLVEYSVSHSNGRGHSGDGNGFKLGCRMVANNDNLARYNVAYRNRANNFDSNSGGGLTMLHNTSWSAGSHGFIAYAPTSSGRAPNVVKNNISYQDGKAVGKSRDDKSSHNSWDLKIDNPQFTSLDPRSHDFLTLTSGSPAVDAGAKLGESYQGTAPDLGALKRGERVAQLLGPVAQLQGGTLKLAGN